MFKQLTRIGSKKTVLCIMVEKIRVQYPKVSEPITDIHLECKRGKFKKQFEADGQTLSPNNPEVEMDDNFVMISQFYVKKGKDGSDVAQRKLFSIKVKGKKANGKVCNLGETTLDISRWVNKVA